MAHIRADLSTGHRIYVETRYGEPLVARLKSLGAHWDAAARCWWLGAAKRASLEELLVAGDKEADTATPAREDPDKIRLTGKGEYKGRTYYLGSETRDGLKVRCLTLPDAQGQYLSFWAEKAQVKLVKTYAPREVWDGRRYSGRTRTEYTTLGSIAKFLAKQANADTRRGRCTECDSWGPAGETCQECHEGTHC